MPLQMTYNLKESRKLEAQAAKLTSQSVKWVKLLEEFQNGLKVKMSQLTQRLLFTICRNWET